MCLSNFLPSHKGLHCRSTYTEIYLYFITQNSQNHGELMTNSKMAMVPMTDYFKVEGAALPCSLRADSGFWVRWSKHTLVISLLGRTTKPE